MVVLQGIPGTRVVEGAKLDFACVVTCKPLLIVIKSSEGTLEGLVGLDRMTVYCIIKADQVHGSPMCGSFRGRQL